MTQCLFTNVLSLNLQYRFVTVKPKVGRKFSLNKKHV